MKTKRRGLYLDENEMSLAAANLGKSNPDFFRRRGSDTLLGQIGSRAEILFVLMVGAFLVFWVGFHF